MKELLQFLIMPTPVEMIMLIRTAVAIHLMILFIVHIFKDMRTRLTFFGGHSICFLILHITPHFLSIMFGDMSSITLSISEDVKVTT